MGIITTIFSETSCDENGEFTRDLADLILKSGQEVPIWLSNGAMKHSSLVKDERSSFYNLVIFSLKTLWKIIQTINDVLRSVCFNIFKLFRFAFFVTTFSIFHLILDNDNIIRYMKSALWIIAYCLLIFTFILVSYLIVFEKYPTTTNSEALYSNLQHIGSDLYENMCQWLIG